MVSCCAHVLRLRWWKNVDSGWGFGQRSSLPWWLVNNCFGSLFFFLEIFFFTFFETSNRTRRLPLGESWEILPAFFIVEIKILALSARVSLRQIRAFIPCFVPNTEKDQLAISPSFYPFFSATGILWFDWPINLSSFKMKGWLLLF